MEILIKALVISLFCVGLCIISSPGMIFYFLRMPYDWLKARNSSIDVLIKVSTDTMKLINIYYEKNEKKSDDDITKDGIKRGFNDVIKKHNHDLTRLRAKKRYNWLIYVLKPIIGCCTCMASVWTIAIELGYYNTFTLQSIIIAFVVAALNSIIHAYYEKLTK